MEDSATTSSEDASQPASETDLRQQLVTFFIPLSRPLNIPHGSTFTFERSGETVEWLAGRASRPTGESTHAFLIDETQPPNFVSLKIWRPIQPQPWHIAPLDNALCVAHIVAGHKPDEEQAVPKPVLPDVATTVIEAVTPVLEAGEGQDQCPLSAEFDRCLEEINVLIAAYFLASGDAHIERVSRQNLFPLIPWATRHIDGSYNGLRGIFFANAIQWAAARLTPVGDDLDEDAMERLGVVLSRAKQNDPFSNYHEWARTAHRELRVNGDYAAAVVAAHTAGEILFDTILYMMAWEEGTPYEEAAEWFEKSGLTARLRSHYHSRLAGAWQPDDTRTVLGKWTDSVTKVRGRVVHAGYRPSEWEATVAVNLLGEIGHFVKDRLAEKCMKYKRTALLLLGQPGLERRGLYGGQIKKFVEEEAGNEDPWIAAYRKWLKL